jgi:S-DNA-T family DNA segregation ATPase FtsK/SpoIIIE
MALGAFALLSIWTSHAADIPGNYFPPNPAAQNRGGMAGAYLAHALSLWMGVLTPFFLAGLLILAGGRIFLRREIRGFWYRVPAAMAFLLCVATAESMVSQGGAGSGGILQGRLSGGVYGTHVASVLRPAFGGLPSLAFVTILGTVALAGTTGGVPSWVRRAASRLPSIKLPKGKAREEEVEEVRSSIVAEFRPAPKPVEVIEDEPEVQEEEPAPVITSVEPQEEEKEEIEVPGPAKEGEYVLPPLSLLEHPEDAEGTPDSLLLEQSKTLEQTLSSFKVEARVSEIQRGPTITMYELELAPGTKVNKIVSLSDDREPLG